MSEQVRKRPGEPLSLWAQFSVFVAASCRRQLAASIRTARLLHAQPIGLQSLHVITNLPFAGSCPHCFCIYSTADCHPDQNPSKKFRMVKVGING